jgi:excisionase family DNA binding protein
MLFFVHFIRGIPIRAGTFPQGSRGTSMDGQPSFFYLSATPERAAELTGLSRTRIFRALKNNELTARKDGSRTTVIEISELQRWIKSLPTRGRIPEDRQNSGQAAA